MSFDPDCPGSAKLAGHSRFRIMYYSKTGIMGMRLNFPIIRVFSLTVWPHVAHNILFNLGNSFRK